MGVEEADKIIRIPGETLLIKLTPEEEKYRNKYLPNPKKLDDEKLVCTVCSVPLAVDIHKGKDIFVHRALNVLVCKVCYDFYGDGCFSADEDGDDKYCRWCGQGGTLYLCSTCTCAFCQKCVKQNLKASVIAELEKDDWKCYICNPRPLFGSRTICWGANELNKISKEKEQERLKKLKEKIEEKKKEENGRRSRKASSSENELPSMKRKARTQQSDSSSPEVMPTKRSRRDSRVRIETGNVNGNINKVRRKQRDSSSDSESFDDKKKVAKRGNSKKNKKIVDSSSEEYSDVKNKSKSKIKKKKPKESSEESSDEDRKKSKRKSIKKKADSSDDEEFDEKHMKRKRLSRKKKEDSDSSSDEKYKKRKPKKKKKHTSSEEESSDDFKKKLKKNHKKKKEETSDSDDDIKKSMKKSKDKKEHKVDVRKKSVLPDSDNEIKKEKKVSDDVQQPINDEKVEVNLLKDFTIVTDNIVRKRIKLAILWLNNTTKDISELGSLISLRATKFGKKKINAENLKSYEDVLSTVNKLKQLISGVHSNYDHIEKTLDAHLKPWKILTGLEETVDNEMHVEDETNNSVNKVVSEVEDTTTVDIQECNDEVKTDSKAINSDKTQENKSENKLEVEDKTKCDKIENTSKTDDTVLNWSGLSGDEDSDNEDKNITDALISKASEVLDRTEEDEDQQLPSIENSDKGIKIDNIDELRNDDKVDTDDETVPNVCKDESINNENSQSRNSEDDSKTFQIDSDEVQTEERKISKESNADHIKENSEESIEKEIIRNTSPLVDKERSDNESEIESSPKEKTPEKILRLEKGNEDTPEKECEDKTKELSTKENKPAYSEEKSETTVSENQNDFDLNKYIHSSDDESSLLQTFSKKIKNKWLNDELQEKTKSETSFRLDNSGGSDQDLRTTERGKKKQVLNEQITEERVKRSKHIKGKKLEEGTVNEELCNGEDLKENQNKLNTTAETETDNTDKEKKLQVKQTRSQENNNNKKDQKLDSKVKNNLNKISDKKKEMANNDKEIKEKVDKQAKVSSNEDSDEEQILMSKKYKKRKSGKEKNVKNSEDTDDEDIKKCDADKKRKSKIKDEDSEEGEIDKSKKYKKRKREKETKKVVVEDTDEEEVEKYNKHDKRKLGKHSKLKAKKEDSDEEKSYINKKQRSRKSEKEPKTKCIEDDDEKEKIKNNKDKSEKLNKKGKLKTKEENTDEEETNISKNHRKKSNKKVTSSSDDSDKEADIKTIKIYKNKKSDENKMNISAGDTDSEEIKINPNDKTYLNDQPNGELIESIEENEKINENNTAIKNEGKEIDENIKMERDEIDTEDCTNGSFMNIKNQTKFVGLDSSSEEINQNGADNELRTEKEHKDKKKLLKKKSDHNKSFTKNPLLLSSSDEESEEEEKNRPQLDGSSDKENKEGIDQGDQRSHSPVVKSSAESSDSEILFVKNKRKKQGTDDSDSDEISITKNKNSDKKNNEGSDIEDLRSRSPVLISSAESSDFEITEKKKRKKQETSGSDSEEISKRKNKKQKRKLIRCANSSSESYSSDEAKSKNKSKQGESPGKGGRKNIKKIKTKDDLEDATKEAADEEKERRRRIEERQKMYNSVFEFEETAKVEKLVLDFDLEKKEELISVHEDLVAKMKPHQAKGVKFMWDSCFESVNELKTKKGSGCILAHCMGLGKTFQVISLVHTLMMHEETKVHTIMVVCPLSTVLNWYNEFDKWLQDVEGGSDIEVFHLTRCKQNVERASELRRWQHNGGVMILGYEMFRNLTCETSKKFRAKMKKDFQETLLDPGADLIVCDEGHMLKNEATALSKAMNKVRTLRRIVLTGTPMQNNLKEYHCMVQFVKPSLLGTRKEFLNRFVNPITNGQFVDSTESDVKVMKRRAHVLHKMLEGIVQRFDYNVLTPFLPPKYEYVISICLSELQIKLYQYYLDNFSQQADKTKAGSRLFQDWQALGRVWTHPRVLKMSTDKANWLKEKKGLEDSEDEEGSLKDFVVDGTTTEDESESESSDGSIKSYDSKKKVNIQRKTRSTRSTRSNQKNTALLESSEEEKNGDEEEVIEETGNKGAWWNEMVEPKHMDDMNLSGKLVLLFAILKECEMIEDKVLVFSQSLFSLDLIEYFLDKIDAAFQEDKLYENLGNHHGNWSKGLDYFRLDGSTSSDNRNIWCNAFNREDNTRARLFLISTRAGGLGINLTAANRVIIFDASWNPSHDVQSIFRIYRFGQKKPCYVYRFIAHGTMEEKVYDRQVAKQSMSNRVVDEQQVHRHFSMNDLNELYSFTPPTKAEDRPIPALPKDVLMAEILTQCRDWIEKYHEHDSLLENVVEEELNEDERKLAWEDYENDKKRGFMPATTGTAGTFNNPWGPQIEFLRQNLKAKYPNKPDTEIQQMLVYQVTMLMKQQQQQFAPQFQMQAVPRPQMFSPQNMTPAQLLNFQKQQLQMQYMQQMQIRQQAQQAANMKNIFPTQSNIPYYQQQMLMQQQANQSLPRMEMQQKMSQSILMNQLAQPTIKEQKNTQPNPGLTAKQTMDLEIMKQNNELMRQKKGTGSTSEKL